MGRAFSNAVIELALASIPGFFGVGGGPGDGRPFGVYVPACVPADAVPQEVVVLGGETRQVSSVIPPAPASVTPPPEPAAAAPAGPTVRAPLGRIFGARSGDKGGDANLGVFARTDAAWAWLDGFLGVERLRELLPEVAAFPIERHRLANLRALNFVIHGLLGGGRRGLDPSGSPGQEPRRVAARARGRAPEGPARVTRAAAGASGCASRACGPRCPCSRPRPSGVSPPGSASSSTSWRSSSPPRASPTSPWPRSRRA